MRFVSFSRVSTIAVLIVLAAALNGCTKLPSDSELRDRFFQKQPDFVKLVQMSNEDQRLTFIGFNSTALDTDASWPRKNIGISEQRWNEYRRMFRELGVEGGLSRGTDYPSAVFLRAYASGGVLGSSGKGFTYSEKPLSPLVNSLDVMPRELYNKNKGHALVFKTLTNDWYMYREEY